MITIFNLSTPREFAREFIEERPQNDRPYYCREKLTFAVYLSHSHKICVAHSLQSFTILLEVRSPIGMRGGIFRSFVTRKFGELVSCCFLEQVIQHVQFLGFSNEEVCAMFLADELGIQKKSDGPFCNIKPSTHDIRKYERCFTFNFLSGFLPCRGLFIP